VWAQSESLGPGLYVGAQRSVGSCTLRLLYPGSGFSSVQSHFSGQPDPASSPVSVVVFNRERGPTPYPSHWDPVAPQTRGTLVQLGGCSQLTVILWQLGSVLGYGVAASWRKGAGCSRIPLVLDPGWSWIWLFPGPTVPDSGWYWIWLFLGLAGAGSRLVPDLMVPGSGCSRISLFPSPAVPGSRLVLDLIVSGSGWSRIQAGPGSDGSWVRLFPDLIVPGSRLVPDLIVPGSGCSQIWLFLSPAVPRSSWS